MNFSTPLSFSNPRIIMSNFLPAVNNQKTIKSIIDGLTSFPRNIPSMFFYDARGSELFKKITQLPEYYLTRIELELIKDFSDSNRTILKDIDIVEFGSGDCSKISIILDSFDSHNLISVCYMPIDVSLDALKESAECIVTRYPGIYIHCIAADFLSHFFTIPSYKKRLFCFFGSTIGNLSRYQRILFLEKISRMMHSGDMLLIGIDMVKQKELLEKAYNDTTHITALFNRNILNVVNSITGTNFDPDSFEHFAFYNRAFKRIEMHLGAQCKMVISCPYPFSDLVINSGEKIHTENSYKFSIKDITDDISSAGLKIKTLRTDKNEWFSLLQIIKGTQ